MVHPRLRRGGTPPRPHRARGQRHSVHVAPPRPMGQPALLRSCLPRAWQRPSVHQGGLALDQRLGRTNEPHHPSCDGQAHHYDSRDHLRTYLQLFVNACSHARRLKTLRGLTLAELILNAWTKEPDRLRINPSNLILGSCTWRDRVGKDERHGRQASHMGD